MSKKSVMLISAVYVIFLIVAFVISTVCDIAWCRIHDDDFAGVLLVVFSSLIFVFLFSLITYKMRDEVFQAWWKFARWFVPVVMLVTFLVNSKSRGGGVVAAMSGGFDILIVGIFYAVFVVVSFVRIVKAYRGMK